MNNPIYLLTFVAALGSRLVAGIFFAFSNFVMKALARVPPAQGVAAMQSIDVVVLNRWFFAGFLLHHRWISLGEFCGDFHVTQRRIF
jgi:uncharacterized membrane protein